MNQEIYFIVGREPDLSSSNLGSIAITLSDSEKTSGVSRTHCMITYKDGLFYIEDLGSTNKTFVDGVEIKNRFSVDENSSIRLGESTHFSLRHPIIQNTIRSISNFDNTPVSTEIEYAGWWQRVGGYLLDSIFLALLSLPIQILVFLIEAQSRDESTVIVANLIYFIGYLIIVHFYYAAPIGRNGTTFGRKIAGVKYLNLDGERNATAGQAWGRFIGYFFSALILFIGFLMPLWDKRKQALHDMIAGTIVVKI